jgi:tRNA(Ile)-lysidine synthase
VLPSFADSGVHSLIIAVSGGADSVSLLTACTRLPPIKEHNIRLIALTVDHGIRAREESMGDVHFVEDYCRRLGIDCLTRSLKPGEVFAAAQERAQGIEEAARFLRYSVFEAVLDETGAAAVCLGHTRDDNLETILLRFLQGSASAPLSGIPRHRGRIVRPMLHISRADVEAYLSAQGIAFRTDSTNCDTAYLRNKIRAELIPVLNGHFGGWQKAVLSGAEKNRDDAETVSRRVKDFSWQRIPPECGVADAVGLPLDTFFFQNRAVRRELLYNAWDMLALADRSHGGSVRRLSYEAVSCVIDGKLPVRFGGVVFDRDSGNIIIKKLLPGEKDGGFFLLIESEGVYVSGNYTVTVSREHISGIKAELPVCVRSPLPSDKITFAGGMEKALSGLLSGAKIPKAHRHLIPVVESYRDGIMCVAAVAAGIQGARDWLSEYSENLPDSAVHIKIEGLSDEEK